MHSSLLNGRKARESRETLRLDTWESGGLVQRTGKGPGIPNSITGVLVIAVVVLVKRRGENMDHTGENVGQV